MSFLVQENYHKRINLTRSIRIATMTPYSEYDKE